MLRHISEPYDVDQSRYTAVPLYHIEQTFFFCFETLFELARADVLSPLCFKRAASTNDGTPFAWLSTSTNMQEQHSTSAKQLYEEDYLEVTAASDGASAASTAVAAAAVLFLVLQLSVAATAADAAFVAVLLLLPMEPAL